ncbi:hypothetical protein [Lewinella sp. LCG006]|uniref:hypothetical protein n=1 Tax=Lewinella sp. LCG006 TaxID=3231911 RepID=UPI00346115EF
MKHQTLIFILLFGFFSIHLHAQPIGGSVDTLDLGGEDVATNMNASRGLDQAIANRNWWLDFLMADSIRARPGLTYHQSIDLCARNYNFGPGSWVLYKDLNIFFFLADLESLQSNLAWHTYRNSNMKTDAGPVRQSPLGGRGRPAAQNSDRVISNPNATISSAAAPPLYPFVRQDVLGEDNARKNPRYVYHQKVVRGRTSPDMGYLSAYKNTQALNRLYHLAFYDGTNDDYYFYGTPNAIVHPDPMIDVGKAVMAVYLDISAMVEGGMKTAYNQQNRSTQATKLSASQVQQAIPLLKNVPIPFNYKRILGARRQQLNANLPGLESSLEALVAQRDVCSAFLSQTELSLFNWLINQKRELVAWQTAAIDGLATILSAPGNAATYSQLAVVSEYLRVSTVLLKNLTENQKLYDALNLVKISYHDAVWAAERDFRMKLNE